MIPLVYDIDEPVGTHPQGLQRPLRWLSVAIQFSIVRLATLVTTRHENLRVLFNITALSTHSSSCHML